MSITHNPVVDLLNKYKNVANFMDFKMVDNKSVGSQLEHFQLILHEIAAEGMFLSESFQVAAIIEKLPTQWSHFKNYLKLMNKEMSVGDLVVRVRLEEENRRAGRPYTEAEATSGFCIRPKNRMKKALGLQQKMPEIPEDVLIIILAKVRVKSLLRFRCVCRTWNRIILGADFIDKHRTMNNNVSVLRFVQPICFLSWLSFDFEDDHYVEVISLEKKIPFLNNVASCNGLLCLRMNAHDDIVNFVLWNPATREMKHLSTTSSRYHWSLGTTEIFGFGFDMKTNDYKVIRFFCETIQLIAANSGFVIHVFSLNTDSWKTIPTCKDFNDFKALTCYSYKDGVCYWLAHKRDGKGAYILSFDMTTEAFQKIQLPEQCIVVWNKTRENLGILNGSLALISFDMKLCYDVWVLSTSGRERCCWILLYARVRPSSSRCCFVGFWSNSGLFWEANTYKMFLYDFKSGRRKCDKSLSDISLKRVFVSYSESLVPINGLKYIDDSALDLSHALGIQSLRS